MAIDGISVSQITTLHSSFSEDIRNYRAAGIDGIGVWEFKLDGVDEDRTLHDLQESGLTVTVAAPAVISIYPTPTPGPSDPDVRVRQFCQSITRLSRFDPQVIVLLTGCPPADDDPDASRATIVDGARAAARVAADHGLVIGLEPQRRDLYPAWSTISGLSDSLDLIHEIDEPNVQLLYDVYHLWDADGVLDETRRHASQFAPCVQVSDWREPTRGAFDRVLPGDGVIDLASILGALDEGGWRGWLDVEIFSDDGTYTDSPHPDSVWQDDPADVLARTQRGIAQARARAY